MNKLKEARKEKGLTADQAAEMLGIRRTYLSQIEDGYRNVSADKAQQIANVYDKKISDIFEAVRFKPLVVSQSENQV